MYLIEKTQHGIKLTFGDFIQQAEMEHWCSEFMGVVDSLGTDQFTVFVDMRTLLPLPIASQVAMEKGQAYARKKGMQRSVVILNNTVTRMQFIRLAKQSGIYRWERYIDAQSMPNWEQVGLDWLTKEIDPDTKTRASTKE